jgi:hypothetical protein
MKSILIMHKGREFSVEEKQLIFRVIKFTEREKMGPVIPHNNVDDRLIEMLNVSQSSITRLKNEMKDLSEQQQAEHEQQQKVVEKPVREERRYTRSETAAQKPDDSSEPPTKVLHRRERHTFSASFSTTEIISAVPEPVPPQKKGRRKIIL